MRIVAALITAAIVTVAASATSLHQAPLSPPSIAAAAPMAKKPKWEFAFGAPQVATAPAATENRVYVPTQTTLYALDARKGKLLWSFHYDFGNVSRVDACVELVVVGTGDRLVAVKPRTGELVWTYRPGPPTGELPAERCEGVYSRFGEDNYSGEKSVYVSACYAPLVKLSMAGEVLWTAPAYTGGALQYATESKGYGLVFFNSYDLSNVFMRYSVVVNARSGSLVRMDGGRKYNTFTKLDAANDLLVEPWTGSSSHSYDKVAMLSVFELPKVSQRYTLHYLPATRADYSITGTALYAMATSGDGLVNDVNFYKYPDVHAIKPVNDDRERQPAQWNLTDVLSLGFTSCGKGLVNFGPRSVDGYDEEDGSHVWRYKGVAVAAGARIPATNTIVAVLEGKVVALDF